MEKVNRILFLSTASSYVICMLSFQVHHIYIKLPNYKNHNEFLYTLKELMLQFGFFIFLSWYKILWNYPTMFSLECICMIFFRCFYTTHRFYSGLNSGISLQICELCLIWFDSITISICISFSKMLMQVVRF